MKYTDNVTSEKEFANSKCEKEKEWDMYLADEQNNLLTLMQIYQEEIIHRDEMFWNQIFKFFYGILIFVLVPKIGLLKIDLPPYFFSVIGLGLTIVFALLIEGYVGRYQKAQDSYQALNDILPDYLQRKRQNNKSYKGIKKILTIRMMRLVGCIMVISLIAVSIISLLF